MNIFCRSSYKIIGKISIIFYRISLEIIAEFLIIFYRFGFEIREEISSSCLGSVLPIFLSHPKVPPLLKATNVPLLLSIATYA